MLGSAPSGVWDTLYSQHDRLFADKVMKESDWQRRRKATHRHRLQPVTLARVMLGYFPLLLWVAVLSVTVGVYDVTLVKWYHWPMLSVSSVQTFFSAITFALTLLLVFKTNSSYARWWEARKDVGQLVSFAHNIMRQAVAYFPPHQAELTHAMARWVSASMWVVKAMVRQGAPLRDELKGVLTPEELTWLMAQPHKQLALGQALSSIVAAADINPMAMSRLDSMLTLFCFEFGACGRIFNTAIPSAYTRHTSRFLMCYCYIGLPLLLWPLAGWASPVLAVLIAFLLLGVENIGCFIEEPFHVVAFDTFCSAVQRDVQNILAMHDNSQCPCCAASQPGGAAAGATAVGGGGGNVPVVRGVTYHQAAAAPSSKTSFPPTAAAVLPGPWATPQSHRQAAEQPELVLPAGVLVPDGVPAASEVVVSMPAQAASVLPQQSAQNRQYGLTGAQEQQQQQVLASSVAPAGLLKASDSQVCLLSGHSHRE